jgi:hypothetical protein
MNSPSYVAGFWDKPLQDLLQLLQATPAGLTAGEAKQRGCVSMRSPQETS